MIEFGRLSTHIISLERKRERRVKICRLLKKSKWDSISDFLKDNGLSPGSTYPVLRALEDNNCITLENGRGRCRKIRLEDEFFRLMCIWEAHPELNGIFRTDIDIMMKKYDMFYVATLLGYTGDNRVELMKNDLKKIGWLN